MLLNTDINTICVWVLSESGASEHKNGMCMNASSDGMRSSMDVNMVHMWFVHERN